MTAPRAAALVLALAATTLGTAVPARAAAPSPSVTSISVGAGDPAYPQLVSLGGTPEAIDVSILTDATVSVEATASGPGLTVTDPVQRETSFTGYVRTNGASFDFHVVADTPGVHALTITFTPDGGTPSTVTLPHLVAAGSTLTTGTDSLAGRAYGLETGRGRTATSVGRRTDLLTFVDDRHVYQGLPPGGRPTCSDGDAHCLPYAYDAATGLLQIGTGIVGELDGQALYTDGWSQEPQVDSAWSHAVSEHPLTYAAKGTRLAGRWGYRSVHDDGLSEEHLTLRRDGGYRLVTARTTTGTRSVRASGMLSSGSYRIGRGGRIVFRSGGKVVSRGTLALVSTRPGRPAARRLGLWLVLSGRHGQHPDGNLLAPKARKG